MEPIWKDKEIIVGTGDSAPYSVLLGGNVIYSGRAYKKPGAASVVIRINDIVSEYLKNSFPGSLAADATLAADGVKSFTVVGDGVNRGTTIFVNDWSYNAAIIDTQWRQLLFLFTDVDARLPILYTRAADAGQTNIVAHAATAGTLQVGSYTLNVGTSTCYRYALYFLNAFGGWSFIYLEAVKPAEDYDRKTAKRAASNAATALPDRRASFAYVNAVTRRWAAKTPFLTDLQAADMWHVLGTTDAWLYDMAGGTCLPVLVDIKTYEQQTYRNQGAKRPRYDLNLTLAEDRLRK